MVDINGDKRTEDSGIGTTNADGAKNLGTGIANANATKELGTGTTSKAARISIFFYIELFFNDLIFQIGDHRLLFAILIWFLILVLY